MLTETLSSVCPPELRVPLARYLAGEISGEITLMHFALHLGEARALASTLEGLVAGARAWKARGSYRLGCREFGPPDSGHSACGRWSSGSGRCREGRG